MSIHIVWDGECLTSVAALYGFEEVDLIKDHPNNVELMQKRPDWNQLFPGDQVFIPEATLVYHLATGKRHTIVVKRPKRLLRVAFLDGDGAPLGGPYKLKAGALEREGSLDGEGILEELLPADIMSAEVEVAGMTRTILIGHLNPLEKTVDGGVSGVQARLSNLGFAPGAVDGDRGPKTRAALMNFQTAYGLDGTGELDDRTLQKLKDAHGC